METISDRLRKARIGAGFPSAQDAADSLGVRYPTYSAHENGTRGVNPEKLKLYARRFKADLDWLITGDEPKEAAGEDRPEPNAGYAGPMEGTQTTIPVYGTAVGGEDGEFEMNGQAMHHIPCPHDLFGIPRAYAVYVSGSSMSPKFDEGEVLHINPAIAPRTGLYVVAQVQLEEHGPMMAFVKRLMRYNTKELVLFQYNPEKELVFPATNVHSVHVVVGTSYNI